MKNKVVVGLFRISQKRDFFFSYDNQVLLGVILQCGSCFWTLQEKPSFPLQFGQEKNILGHSTESRAY